MFKPRPSWPNKGNLSQTRGRPFLALPKPNGLPVHERMLTKCLLAWTLLLNSYYNLLSNELQAQIFRTRAAANAIGMLSSSHRSLLLLTGFCCSRVTCALGLLFKSHCLQILGQIFESAAPILSVITDPLQIRSTLGVTHQLTVR